MMIVIVISLMIPKGEYPASRSVGYSYPAANLDTAMSFEVKDHVVKKSGYNFPGVIVAKFQTTMGETRYVVECTVEEVVGMLHIFNGDQLLIRRDEPQS